MIVLILTAIGMAIGVLVKALLPGRDAGTAGGAVRSLHLRMKRGQKNELETN